MRCRGRGEALGAARGYGFSVARMHLASWPGAISISSGMAASQAGMHRGQRGAKEHPGGSAPGEGTAPSMARSGSLRLVFERGDGAEQAAGVGVRGALEELAHGSAFDDSSGIHHGDAVADAADYGEVVRDEEHGEREAAAQVGEQFERSAPAR